MNIALVLASGVGSRMNSKGVPKQFLEINGKPIVIYTLEVFQNHPKIDCIVVTCLEERILYMRKLLEEYGITKVQAVVSGGDTRQQSVYKGLLAAEKVAQGQKNVVLIHDGVRPLIYQETITDNIESVEKNGSGITSAAVKETVVVSDAQSCYIETIPPKNLTRMARSPQSFFLDEIITLYRRAQADGKVEFVDSCSMMKYYNKELYLVDGPQENIKITTPDDFYMFRALLVAKENAQIYGL